MKRQHIFIDLEALQEFREENKNQDSTKEESASPEGEKFSEEDVYENFSSEEEVNENFSNNYEDELPLNIQDSNGSNSIEKESPSEEVKEEEEEDENDDPYSIDFSYENQNLNHKQVREISKSLKLCVYITKLNLSGNNLSLKSIQALAEGLRQNKGLIELNLSDTNLGPEAVTILCDALTNHTSIQVLNLSQNSIGNEGAYAVGTLVANHSSLLELNLSQNELWEEGAEGLIGGLTKDKGINNPTLVSLDLSQNEISVALTRDLFSVLYSFSSLTYLYFEENVNVAYNHESTVLKLTRVNFSNIRRLTKELGTKKNLQELDLSGNDLSGNKMKLLSHALSNSSIDMLNLMQCSIEQDEAIELSKALATNTTLVTLGLSGNEINVKGAQAICKALYNNTSVRYLYLKGTLNEHGDGAYIFADLLTRNQQLELLDISSNSIQDKDAIKISRSLHNSSLRVLKIHDNEIKDVGVDAISSMLKTNCKLEELDLRYINMTDKGAITLSRAIASNNTLTELNLSGNDLSEKGIEAFSSTGSLKVLTMENLTEGRDKSKLNHAFSTIVYHNPNITVENPDDGHHKQMTLVQLNANRRLQFFPAKEVEKNGKKETVEKSETILKI